MSETMTVVERVAREMCHSLHGDTHSGRWEIMQGDVNLSEEFKDRFRKMARVALETLREPTERMVEYAHQRATPLRSGYDEDGPDVYWRNMIDAALSEPETTP